MRYLVVCLVLLVVVSCVECFYLPRFASRKYKKNEPVEIKVNSIKSTKTGIPYDYYSLMVCRPDDDLRNTASMGDMLWGDSVKQSPFNFQLGKDISCQKVCSTNSNKETIQRLKRRIDDEYRGQFILGDNNSPLFEAAVASQGYPTEENYKFGYPLGVPEDGTNPTIVHNHLQFKFKVQQFKADHVSFSRIVGFEVTPFSVLSSKIDTKCNADSDFDIFIRYFPQPVEITTGNATQFISWSYSVKWEMTNGTWEDEDKADVAWSSQWEWRRSLGFPDEKIHRFEVVNPLILALFLIAVVITILRNLHKEGETGWKIVHGDVFREPSNSGLLSAFVGTGAQLLGTLIIALPFALMGFLPASRDHFTTVVLILYAVMGYVGGLVTAMVSKMFHEQSCRTICLTGFIIPGTVFIVFVGLNLMLWAKGAYAVSLVVTMKLLGLWLFVDAPLIILGYKRFTGFILPKTVLVWLFPVEKPLVIVGYKHCETQNSQVVNETPRPIPKQRWYMRPTFMVLCSGFLPFCVLNLQLHFIFTSLWLNKYHFAFGIFAIIFVILVIICATLSMVLTYYQLRDGDHSWWWRAYLYSGSTGVYIFLFSIYFFFSRMNMNQISSIVLYFSYMGILSFLFSVITGTIGFVATLIFVRYLYLTKLEETFKPPLTEETTKSTAISMWDASTTDQLAKQQQQQEFLI